MLRDFRSILLILQLNTIEFKKGNDHVMIKRHQYYSTYIDLATIKKIR